MKTMTASNASKNFGEYIDKAQREPVIVTRQSRPVAVTFSIEEAEMLMRGRVEAGISKGLADIDAGRVHDWESATDRVDRFKARLAQMTK